MAIIELFFVIKNTGRSLTIAYDLILSYVIVSSLLIYFVSEKLPTAISKEMVLEVNSLLPCC